jgi:hypothetical protein
MHVRNTHRYVAALLVPPSFPALGPSPSTPQTSPIRNSTLRGIGHFFSSRTCLRPCTSPGSPARQRKKVSFVVPDPVTKHEPIKEGASAYTHSHPHSHKRHIRIFLGESNSDAAGLDSLSYMPILLPILPIRGEHVLDAARSPQACIR